MTQFAIQPDDVRAAAGRIRPLARRTPVMGSPGFDSAAGVRTLFKCENLQAGGAFKIRGASNLILSLPKETLARGVVAYSSGNHAQATAIAAASVGAPASIVMPEDAPRSKMEATRRRGARIVTYNRFQESREAIAACILKDTGPLDALVTPVGGGGLLAGCATIAKAMHPGIRIFGAEPEAGNDMFLSMIAGERVAIGVPDTIADGLRTQKPGEFTFPVVRHLAERIVLVSDQELRETVKFLLLELKILAEPSGAAAAAAVLFRKLPEGIRSVGVVISGGNVDFDELAKY